LVDPLGEEIVLHDRTWFGHIVKRRAELRPYRQTVEDIVRSPMVVLRSDEAGGRPRGRVYLGRCPDRKLLIKVCVEEITVAGRPELIVKTAYLCRTAGPGEQLWP
jgi:hypothetical protein